MATIYEVAARAGVSPATVSRVFNGRRVSEAKVLAVRDAATELAFVPNRVARTLRRRNSEVIALVLPDIENPYFTEMARGVEDVAQQAGYSVVLCNTDERSEKEAKYLQIAVSENMAGVILAPTSEETDLGPLLREGRPVVAVDRSTSHHLDRVMMSNRDAGRDAAHALVDAGYRRIACITGPESIETARDRADGWREIVGDVPLELLRFATFRVDGGRRAMEELLRLPDPPDAVVAGNNLLGVGVLQVLSEHEMTPPRLGFAVIGRLPFTTLTPDAITVVRLRARQMGTTAAQMLMERIAGDTQPARTVVLRNQILPAARPPSPVSIVAR